MVSGGGGVDASIDVIVFVVVDIGVFDIVDVGTAAAAAAISIVAVVVFYPKISYNIKQRIEELYRASKTITANEKSKKNGEKINIDHEKWVIWACVKWGYMGLIFLTNRCFV